MSKIGVFYGPAKGSTEKVAKIIVHTLGEDKAELVSVENATLDTLLSYPKLILGIATVGRDAWDTDHGQRGWDIFLPKLAQIQSLTEHKIALFGLGNQVTYPTMFCDAMGRLAIELRAKGAQIVGETSPEGYDFEDSEAFVNGQFVGLPLDDDNQPELTQSRVEEWLARLDW